ncbi:hypothetical protein L873DRAFT_1793060 [Choiromyces venosus 120613-1]|uniref:Uncharacterized protein n=1 Tax=Choiromyces venosus 120613-1 TaxID=1336337 RepID=A0A3N4JBB0_9PEZI|nr:hypothetical protein L873DRAFT_1793060 [Choiromyces venosus 120613-1]
MATSALPPQLLVPVPSTESSPPPSPVPLDASASIQQSSSVKFNQPRRQQFLPLPSHQPLAASTSDHPNIPPTFRNQSTRPRLPGRQETPPSPPNSVLLDQSPTFPSQPTLAEPIAEYPSSRQSITGTNVEGPGASEHQTPPSSLKDRLTRAFKGHKRGESDVSMSTNINPRDGASTSNHRHNNSDSTVVTSTTAAAQNIKDNNTILQTYAARANLGFSPTKPDFYTHQWASPIRPNSQNHYTYGHGGTKRRIMNGGEVRVEILPHPSVIAETSAYEEEEKPGLFEEYKGQGRGNPQRGQGVNHLGDAQLDDAYHIETPDSRPSSRRSQSDLNNYLPPLNHSPATMGDTSPSSQTATTLGSAVSRDIDSSGYSWERMFVEESTASFGFENFHMESENDSYFAGLPSPNIDNESTFTGLYGSSGMASSGVLASVSQGDLSTQARSNSSLGGYSASKNSGSVVGRPGLSRNHSSSSHYLALQRGAQVPSSGHSPIEDALAKELKRLSKISAGSGVSGVAIVVTSDEPASTSVGEDSDDDGEDQRWTKEEKGKGRAPRSVDSSNGGMVERGGSGARLGNHKEHHRSGSGISRVSGWSLGDQSGGTGSGSDGGDDDSRELLKGVDQSKKRKLKSQMAPKDQTPILVPQYTFPSESSFPNRNALTLPIPAKISSPNLRGVGHTPLATRYGSSPITKPEGAVVRSPDLNDSYYGGMTQGDQANDTPAHSARSSGSLKSIAQSMSESRMEELVHPAHRKASGLSQHGGRNRGVVSMGSLEGITGIGLKPMPSPGLSNSRFVGSSLADTSDIGHPFEETTAKSGINPKRVRMSVNLDEIAPAPQHYFEREPEVQKQRRSIRLPALGPRPMRPKNLRRSMTPHLYAPRPLGDSWKDLADIESLPDNEQTLEYRRREKRAGRLLLGLCMLFPPLLLVVAWGGFDVTVEGWTAGQVKGVGRAEKRIAAWVGGAFAVCVVAGIIAGAVVVSI